MNSSTHFALAATLGLSFLSSPASAQPAAGITATALNPTGHWEGTMALPAGPVTFSMDLAKNASGVWLGSLSIVGTTAVGVPLDAIVVEGASARFHAGLVESPTFTGTLTSDGNGLSGEVSNTHGSVPFQLKRMGAAQVSVPPPSTPLTKDIEGAWEGALKTGGGTMRVALKVFPGPGGVAAATLVNLDRGNVPVPISTVIFQKNELRLESRAVSGSYTGKTEPDGSIVGEWTQGSQKVPLTFKRTTVN